MAGELVPLVMMPRYSVYSGETTFTTIAMDVTDYQTAILNLWRGKLVTNTTLLISAEESTDQVTWATCTGGTGVDPGVETEVQMTATLKKRWFRLKLVLGVSAGSPYPVATCWAVGYLEQREQ
jgi:hypothetical protein